ncbi:hypothetical protein [Thalassospira aquimaris]|uniref:Uncharacterized protein n=1 Tax=Thalassospira aquimaris TaxID=3037796 RepID=A0ABT6G7G7_9PROT|nr:hypothetical protein [Thalassospira sp. FZY0004]MDG4717984.1 hypothetical protein [Thalassospira sp. FZY0004]
MTQENRAVGSLPTPAFLRLFDDDHVSDNNLALNHPPAPGQCITTLQPESADISDSNLALSHPPAPCQCITTLQPENADVSDSNLALSHPPAPCQCICTLLPENADRDDSIDLSTSPYPVGPSLCFRPGKDELSVQFDDLDLSAPPPGFHTQSCACGLGCVSPVTQKSEA